MVTGGGGIIIKGNTGTDIGGDLINVRVPEGTPVEISENRGERVAGELVSFAAVAPLDRLLEAVDVRSLSPEAARAFLAAANDLRRARSPEGQAPALAALQRVAEQAAGSVAGQAIVSFLKSLPL